MNGIVGEAVHVPIHALTTESTMLTKMMKQNKVKPNRNEINELPALLSQKCKLNAWIFITSAYESLYHLQALIPILRPDSFPFLSFIRRGAKSLMSCVALAEMHL